jgi:hypothetical protein
MADMPMDGAPADGAAEAPPAPAEMAKENVAEGSDTMSAAMACVAMLVDAGVSEFSMDATGDVVSFSVDGNEQQVSAEALSSMLATE